VLVAIRGAVQVGSDTPADIAAAVAELVGELTRQNDLAPERMISALFTMTPDLSAAFPAAAARERGWGNVPMLCAQEIAVPGAMPRVCRVLVHADCDRPARHVYLGVATALRPDLPRGG
jgi:chorismate mutase